MAQIVNQVLNFLGLLLRPPKFANVQLEDVDRTALDFVEPFFVLSTGRCGTKWLTELLRKATAVRVNHSDYPELLRESRMAYEEHEREPRLFQEIVRTARDGYLLDAYRRNLRYVETNHRITFFAHAVRQVYPKARFIHLIRHPGDFVRSGIRRGWYGGSYYDLCRPTLEDETVWNGMSSIGKLAWLWNETNQFVESFLENLPPEFFLRVKAEEMFSQVGPGLEICEFVGVKISRSTVGSMLLQKINQQRTGSMEPYEKWSAGQKAQLRQHAKLAEAYRYEL